MELRSEEFLQRQYDVRTVFNGDWMPAVAVALLPGPMRNSELRAWVRSVNMFDGWKVDPPVISDKMLCDTLNRLVADGLVLREERSRGVPREVVYAATPVLTEAVEAGLPAAEWAARHRAVVAEIQRRRLSS